MNLCYYCKHEVELSDKKCSHCGKADPTGRPFYSFPSVIILFLVCCAICFSFLRVLAGLPNWLAALLAIAIVVAFFVVMVRMATDE